MKIGLEIHVQLPTKSKMFCSCSTESADYPNTNVCPVCLGMPGSKPSLNKQAVILGLKIAKMLKCTVPDTTWFSRKTYFYPDLCKHYQITQYDMPIGEKGEFVTDGKKVRITRVHLEEDPGKTKRMGEESSLIDYNRSGIPLVEIVTEPDIKSPLEARKFLKDLLSDIRNTIDLVDDGERSVRCDCNISVGKERCEVKNVTGLKNVEACLKYEMVRQTKVLSSGGKIERETRRFDEERKVTLPARKKEYEADYGYIGEPDLGIYHIADIAKSISTEKTSEEIGDEIAEKYGIEKDYVKQLIDTSRELPSVFAAIVEKTDVAFAKKYTSGVISSNWKHADDKSKDVESFMPILIDAFKGKITDVEAENKLKHHLRNESVEDEPIPADVDLEGLIVKALEENPQVIEDYKKNEKAANRIIGTVLKQTGGKCSSAQVVKETKRIIESRL